MAYLSSARRLLPHIFYPNNLPLRVDRWLLPYNLYSKRILTITRQLERLQHLLSIFQQTSLLQGNILYSACVHIYNQQWVF